MKQKTIKSVSQIAIIVLILIFFMYPDELLEFSYSHLGKFIALLFIIFTTCVNVLYGTFLCALFILYYQSDMVEGMIHYDFPNGLSANKNPRVQSINGELVEKSGYDVLDFIIDPPDPDFMIDIENTGLSEDFAYTEKDNFRKKNCYNGQLVGEIHKGIFSDIKNEFADAIFPGLLFKHEVACNPCDNNCEFSLTNSSNYSLY